MATKKITLELHEQTFAWLEILVVGLARESLSDEEYQKRLVEMARKDKDDFGVGVRDLLAQVADSLADGVRRSGSWERQCLSSLTGYEGSYVRGIFADCIKKDAESLGFQVDLKSEMADK
ncbi:hypothetical protein [Rheinheimera hassiensis]|uniref:hypothetical protein n=1 Tax=Rheinheimera hassiensis TaxID=1193627 RepID=UPI001F064F58|nr:hypothetical protein [Rheinheimera hassiensis]